MKNQTLETTGGSMPGMTRSSRRDVQMSLSGRCALALVLTLSVAGHRAMGQPASLRERPAVGTAQQVRTKTGGGLKMLCNARRAGMNVGGLGKHARRMIRDNGELNVTITLEHELSPMEIDHYVSRGVRFMQLGDGRIANYDRFYPAWVSEATLEWLNDDPSVKRVGLGGPLDSETTLDQSVPEIEADIRHRTPAGTSPLGNQGDGIVIANFDTGIDVFHPDFFKPRNGLFYDWIDDNNDGQFSRLLDCVDLDRSGTCNANERLSFESFPFVGRNRFDPQTDWLYVDTNANGERDFGPQDGFQESDDCYGEIMFIANDANGNSILDAGEKLTPLGKSKIRALLTADAAGNPVEYRRGINLIDAPVDSNGHGTSVSSIMVAQDYGFNRKFVGVAPDAELLAIDRISNGNHVYNISWAKNNGADIMLWEFGGWGSQMLDGSSPLEQAISQEMQTNSTFQVTPNGNLGSSDRHAEIFLNGNGDQKIVSFHIPAGKTPGSVVVSAMWYGETDSVTLALKKADTATFTAQYPGFPPLEGDHLVQPQFLEKSDRGTVLFYGYLQKTGTSMAGNETWDLRLTNNGAAVGKVHLFVKDDVTTWTNGVYWTSNTTAATTVTWPATADTALNVGSYSVAYQGIFSEFSGRGPRIDGYANLLDITAPGHGDIACASTGGGFYWSLGTTSFGGTSAAGPHAAGAAALLMSAVQSATPTQVADAMVEAARQDSDTGPTYNEDWGHGKLRVDAAYQVLAGDLCPSITVNPLAPANGAFDLDPDGVVYSWSDHPNAQVHDLFIGTTNPPMTEIPGMSANSIPAGSLEPNTTYYWQVYGRNFCGYTAASPVRSFTTGGIDAPEVRVTVAAQEVLHNGTYTFEETMTGTETEATFTIHNDGSQPLELNGAGDLVQLAGGQGVFEVVEDAAALIQPLDSTDVTVVFAPQSEGEFEKTMFFNSNDDDESPYIIKLRGHGVAHPEMLVTYSYQDENGDPQSTDVPHDSPFSFPDTELDDEADLIFLIHNEGDGELTLTGDPAVQIGGEHADDFAVSLAPTGTTILGGSEAFRIAFVPSEQGTRSATVTIPNNDATRSPYVYTISGFGVDPNAAVNDCNGNNVADEIDVSNGDSEDCNLNSKPDECELDEGLDGDGDGVINDCDVCPGHDDGIDSDGDETPDCLDNCPDDANPDQTDSDGNGVGDVCDVPVDPNDCNGNGIDDATELATGAAEDCNANGTPDDCENDEDGDGAIDGCDECPDEDDSLESDGDGIKDCLDNCPAVVNPLQTDADGNGIGDACEGQQNPFDCNDNGVNDEDDVAEGRSEDCNGNSVPDECELDGDEDGTIDACDQCPGDDDGLDSDRDGLVDCLDNCPAVRNSLQVDSNDNGIGDVCEVGAPTPPETFCGAGAVGMLPAMLLGLGGVRVGRRRRSMVR